MGQNAQLFKGSALVATVAAAIAAATPGAQPLSAFFFNFAATYAMGKWAQIAAARGYQQEIVERRAMIRSATAPQRIVWGHSLVGGTVAYGQVTGADKEYLHLVIALAGHQVHSIGEIMFDDQVLGDRDVNGDVTTGTFAGLVRVTVHLGTPTQAADAGLIAASAGKWTTAHQGKNIAYVYVRLKWDLDKFPNGTPNIRVLVRGRECYDPRDGVTRLTMNPALILRDYYTAPWGLKCEASEIDDVAVAAAANTCDEWVDAGIASVAVTATHTSDTLALSAHDARLSTGDRLVLGGTTAPAGLTLGATYYLVRTGGTTVRLASTYQNAIEGTTLTFTDNGTAVTLTDVHQRRYAFAGSTTLDRQPPDIDNLIREAMAGAMVWSAGLWRTSAGVYTAPAVGDTIDGDDLRGAAVYIPRRSRHELTNRINGIFVDPGQGWAAVDFPPVSDATFVAQDGGEVIARDVEFAGEINALRAQRLAKIVLRRGRVAQLALPCKISALRFATTQTVSVTLPELGLTDAVFRIVGLKITGADGGVGVDLQLEADSADLYDWATSDGVAPSINSGVSLVDPRVVGAPTSFTLTSGNDGLIASADGTIISRIKATWVHAVEPNPLQYEVQWKRSTDTSYESRFVPRTENVVYLSPVEDGATYDVRVRLLNVIGVRSAWVADSEVVVGKADPPTAPVSLSLVAALGGVDIAWSACPDADYARSELVESISNDRAVGTSIFVQGNRTARTGLPGSVERWYWVRHIDRSGNLSAWYPSGATAGLSAVTLSPSGGGVRVVTDATAITAGSGSPPPGGDDYWAVFSNHDGKVYRWSSAAGAYSRAVDGSDIIASSIAADRLAAANLGAIRADLGTVTAGNFTLDNAGYIRSAGATWAAGTGIWLGYDGSAYKFRIGNPAGENLTWDGSALTFSGALSGATGTFSGALSAATGSFGAISADGAITLSTTGHIKGGQTTYNTGNGFFLGYNAGQYRFSLGNSAGQNIRWDGSSLTITGQVVATGNLLNNAVTNVQSAYAAGGVAVGASWVTCASVSVTTIASAPVIVWIAGYKNNSLLFQVRIYRNGTLLAEIPPGFPGGSNTFSHVLTDTPGAGTHTYSWQLIDTGGGCTVYSRSIVVMEAKR